MRKNDLRVLRGGGQRGQRMARRMGMPPRPAKTSRQSQLGITEKGLLPFEGEITHMQTRCK